MKIDMRDVLVFGGLGMIGVGFYLIRPEFALVAIGTGMFILGIR